MHGRNAEVTGAARPVQRHIVEIHTNPRDVVSVPTDGGGEKVRVCRYRVAAVVRTPLVATNDYRYW
jgi:hypothetical protein